MNAHLKRAIGRAVGLDDVRVLEAHTEPIAYDAFLAGRALRRVRATVIGDGRRIAASLVEKVTDGPDAASAYLYDNGLREFRAYESGLLDDLAPGLEAPRLLAAERAGDGTLTLWMEDLGEVRRPLPEADLLRAARHLGRLAGRWLGRVPDAPWLFRGWIDRHMQPHAIGDGLEIVRRGADRPSVNAALGGRLAEGIRLIEAQDAYRRALQSLPQTLCHHDAVAANVFPRDGRDARTVLIDWESVGPGPIGADLASLLFSSARRGDIDARTATALVEPALEACADGIADAGASVSDHDLRLGLGAAISLRWTLVRDVVRVLLGEGGAMRGSAPDEAPEEAMRQLIALSHLLLDAAADARRLSLR